MKEKEKNTVQNYKDQLIEHKSKYIHGYNLFCTFMYDLGVDIRCSEFEMNKVQNDVKYTLSIWKLVKDISHGRLQKVCEYLAENTDPQYLSKNTRFPSVVNFKKALSVTSVNTNFKPENLIAQDDAQKDFLGFMKKTHPHMFKKRDIVRPRTQIERFKEHFDRGEVFSYHYRKWVPKKDIGKMVGKFIFPEHELNKGKPKGLLEL